MSRHYRATLIKTYEHRYAPKGRVGDPCTYCGEPSEHMDHVPPLWACDILAPDFPRENFITVPACAECNSHLGGKLFMTIAMRRQSVRGFLRRKYAKLLKMPQWDEDELSEMSPQFAQHIRACSGEAKRARARIAATLGVGDRKGGDQ